MRYKQGIRLRHANGMGDLVPAVIPIMPDPVLTPAQVAAMQQATVVASLNGVGCSACEGANNMRRGMGIAPTMMWPALQYQGQQGRDIDFTVVGLAGMGDFVQANVSSQPGIIGPLGQGGSVAGQPGMRMAVSGKTNGLVNALSQARGNGVGAIATDSVTDFINSVETGSSTFFGYGPTLPNYVWLGGAAVLLMLLMQSGKHGRR
jgi:hypothetical protein